MSDYLERTNNGTSFSGSDMDIVNAAALAAGLRLYAKSGIKPTKVYTPTYMRKLATHFTGRKYGRNNLLQAAADLSAFVEERKAQPKTDQQQHDKDHPCELCAK